MTLPTKQTFLSNLEIVSQCTICLQPLDTTDHIAVRTSCNHLFGESRLNTWIESDQDNSAACPSCRTVLFIKPLTPPRFISGRPDVEYRAVDGNQTGKILEELWLECHAVKGEEQLTDFGLEVLVQRAARKASGGDLWLWTADIVGLVQVAKEMIVCICKNPNEVRLGVKERDDVWVPRFTVVVGMDRMIVDVDGERTLVELVEEDNESEG